MESAFQLKRIKEFPTEVYCIILGAFFTAASYVMAWPFLSIILYENFKMSALEIGGMLSSATLIGIFIGFLGGYLSDIIGRKRVLVLGFFLSAFAFYLIAEAQSPIGFSLGMMFSAMGMSLNESTGKSILADSIDDKKTRELAYYIRYFFINIGAALGPIIGVCFGLASKQMTFGWSAVFYALFGIFLLFSLKDRPKQKGSTFQKKKLPLSKVCLEILHSGLFLRILLVSVIVTFVYSNFGSSLYQYLTRSGVQHLTGVIASLIATNGITIIIFQFPVLKLIEKYSNRIRIYIGMGLLGLSQIFYAYVPVQWTSGLIVTAIILSIGELIAFPTLNVELDKNIPPHLRGSFFGAATLSRFGFACGPFIGGFLLDHFGGKVLFLFLAFITIPSFIILKNSMKKYEDSEENVVEGNLFLKEEECS